MIRFVPGFIAAVAAFIVLKIFSWIDSLSLHILIFFGAYVVVFFIVDAGLKRYSQTKK